MTQELADPLGTWIATAAEHARSTWPDECCGLIVHTPRGLEARRGRNLAKGPRFQLDPATLIRARRANEAIVGLYHSHPDGSTTWSTADQQGALLAGRPAWPNVAWVTIGADAQGITGCAVRRWSTLEQRFIKVSRLALILHNDVMGTRE